MSLRAIQVYEGEGIAPPPAPKPPRPCKRFEEGRIVVDDIGYLLRPTSSVAIVLIEQTYSGRWAPAKLGRWTFDARDAELRRRFPNLIVDSPNGPNATWSEWHFTRKTLTEFIRQACK